MRELVLFAIHLILIIVKLLCLGRVRDFAAESLLLMQPLSVDNRSRQRAPNVTTLDRFVVGPIALFMRPSPIP